MPAIVARMRKTAPAVATAGQDLRNARKAFTRAHICAAARQLFVENGYAATTMEQIGKSAGAPRSTLYTHFSDKEQILDSIADDYIIKLVAILACVPSPRPTRAEIRDWIGNLAGFISEDRMPTILFNGIGVGLDMPRAVRRIGENVMEVLASRLPAFAIAMTEGPAQPAYRAYAQAAVRELSLCCQTYAILGDEALGGPYLDVAADIFHHFALEFAGRTELAEIASPRR